MIEISDFLLESTIERACAIQQVIGPTFHEADRADFMYRQFEQLGLVDLQRDDAGNILARLPGGDSAPLVLSAHLDTVYSGKSPVPLQRTGEQITGPAIGDNSLGLAALPFLVQLLRQEMINLPGDVWLVANVQEEGLGNLRGMQAVVDRFTNTPIAYVIVEGLGLGNIFHRGLGVERLRVSVQTEGGHSWSNFGQPSAIHELARIVTRITDLPIPDNPRSSFNIGMIEGGISINTIAPFAAFDLDLRSEDAKTLKTLVQRVRQIGHQIEKKGIRVSLETIGMRPAGEISSTHPLVTLAKNTLETLSVQPNLSIGSTDANIPLAHGLPAVCIGMTTGGKSHTVNEYIDISPLKKGLALLFMLAQNIWKISRT